MTNKNYGFKEGFLLGGGLLAAGILLQIAVGPVRWGLFAWPANIVALALFSGAVALMYALRRRIGLFEWMMHAGAAVPALGYALILTALMGLTIQTDFGGIPWLSQMLSFWPFVLAWAWVCLICGLSALNHLLRWRWKEIPFILNHLGVYIAILCAVLGGADLHRWQMTVYEGTRESQAHDEYGITRDPGLAIELHDFIMETYEDGSPRRFASEVTVYAQDGRAVRGTVEVNQPLKVDGWKIYQYNYDARRGAESAYSGFELVRDPWLPAVYLGIYMMLAGAVCLMLLMAPRPAKKEEKR